MAFETIPIEDAAAATHLMVVDNDGTGKKTQVVKMGHGAEGAAPTPVSTAAPMPTVQTGPLAVTTVPVDPFGVSADAVVAAGAGGSISAKLRRLTTDLDTALTRLSAIQAALEGTLDVAGAVALAGNEPIGYVGGFLETIRPVTTVNTTPYTIGDTLCGEIVLTNAMRTPGGSGLLTDLLLSREGAAFGFKVLIFDSNPSSTSTINNAFAWGSGDKARRLGEVVVASDAEEWTVIDGDAVLTLRGINMGVDNAENTQDLYAHIVLTDAITLAVGDISTAFKFIQN
jgi:hypothetical protein